VIEGEPADRNLRLARLSPRETEVLVIAARGATNDEIARQLVISIHAVKFHLAAIYRKFGVSNRTEAVVLYLRGNTVEEPARLSEIEG
jgi:DNA-binding CsgD family transcriptional regulator